MGHGDRPERTLAPYCPRGPPAGPAAGSTRKDPRPNEENELFRKKRPFGTKQYDLRNNMYRTTGMTPPLGRTSKLILSTMGKAQTPSDASMETSRPNHRVRCVPRWVWRKLEIRGRGCAILRAIRFPGGGYHRTQSPRWLKNIYIPPYTCLRCMFGSDSCVPP